VVGDFEALLGGLVMICLAAPSVLDRDLWRWVLASVSSVDLALER
jgi:hypothetical protein